MPGVVQPLLQGRQVLSPIEGAVHDVTIAGLRSARGGVDEGEIVRPRTKGFDRKAEEADAYCDGRDAPRCSEGPRSTACKNEQRRIDRQQVTFTEIQPAAESGGTV